MKIVLHASLHVFSMLDKIWLTLVTDRVIIRITVENTYAVKVVCKYTCMITMCLVIKIFLIRSQ